MECFSSSMLLFTIDDFSTITSTWAFFSLRRSFSDCTLLYMVNKRMQLFKTYKLINSQTSNLPSNQTFNSYTLLSSLISHQMNNYFLSEKATKYYDFRQKKTHCFPIYFSLASGYTIFKLSNLLSLFP